MVFTMKKILTSLLAIVFALLIVAPTALAAEDEQTVVSSFEEVIQQHINSYQDDPRTMVYYVPGDTEYIQIKGGWRKSKCTVSNDYTYDIQKTNSIITPYTSTLTYKMKILVTNAQASKAAAEACETFNDDHYPNEYRITFSYQHNQWVPKKYEERSLSPLLDNQWSDINETSDNTQYKRVVVK